LRERYNFVTEDTTESSHPLSFDGEPNFARWFVWQSGEAGDRIGFKMQTSTSLELRWNWPHLMSWNLEKVSAR
jgi:hypothetical protein